MCPKSLVASDIEQPADVLQNNKSRPFLTAQVWSCSAALIWPYAPSRIRAVPLYRFKIFDFASNKKWLSNYNVKVKRDCGIIELTDLALVPRELLVEILDLESQQSEQHWDQPTRAQSICPEC